MGLTSRSPRTCSSPPSMRRRTCRASRTPGSRAWGAVRPLPISANGVSLSLVGTTTTSSASWLLRVSQRARLYAASRWGKTVCSKRSCWVFSCTRLPSPRHACYGCTSPSPCDRRLDRSPCSRRLGARPFYSLCSTNTIRGNIWVGTLVEVAVSNVSEQLSQDTLLERSEPMNRSTRWNIFSPLLLLALLLPILAACGGSPQAAAPSASAVPAAPTTIAATSAPAAPTAMAPAVTSAPAASASGLNKLNHVVVILQ